MSNLDLNTFNNILFGAFKDQSNEKKIELLEMELEMVANAMFEAMCELCDELNDKGYKSEKLTIVNNIKNNGEKLMTEISELKEKNK